MQDSKNSLFIHVLIKNKKYIYLICFENPAVFLARLYSGYTWIIFRL